ncbi:MAG: transposase, partial [bacterium]
RRGGLTTNTRLEAELSLPASETKRRYPGKFNTSLNQDRGFVTHQAYVEKHCDRLGFLTIRNARFHVKGNAHDALSYLAWKKPGGITAQEANQLLHRDCDRALRSLAEEGQLRAETIPDQVVYLHPKRWRYQAKERLTNPRLAPAERKPADEQVLNLPDVFTTLRQLQPDVNVPGLTPEEAFGLLCAVFTRIHNHDSYRSLERRLDADPRVRTACSLQEAPDHVTVWRYQDALEVAQVQALFTRLVRANHGNGITTGRFLVVDATHVWAWANTRRTIHDGDVEGAAWGQHEGSFYGYKVHVLVDAEAELPVAVVFTPGNAHDRTAYIPLLDDLEQRYPKEALREVLGVFADAAYYDEGLRAATMARLNAPLNAAINPRRNKFLKTIKQQIRDVLEREPELDSVDAVLARLNQRFLHQYGVDVGTSKESAIVGAIRDALRRRLRVAVERVIGRLKTLTPLEWSRSQDWPRVMKHFLLCMVWMHLVAATAHRVGLPGNALSLTRVV